MIGPTMRANAKPGLTIHDNEVSKMAGNIIGIGDYNNGKKNHWRRQVWNDIASRVADKRSSNVVYLPADRDLDRKVAVSKGFNQNRMYAVDFNTAIADRLSGQGKAAIAAPLLAALRNWGSAEKIDVLHADLCCGFTQDVHRLLFMVDAHPAIRAGAVILINLQRGRETGIANGYMKKLIDPGEDKHRGRAVFSAVLYQYIGRYHQAKGIDISDAAEVDRYGMFDALSESLQSRANAQFYSYVSKRVVMDTVVYTKPVECSLQPRDFNAIQRYADPGLRRSIAAKRAIQTMRNSGTLKPSPRW